jgi:hypothetical protein
MKLEKWNADLPDLPVREAVAVRHQADQKNQANLRPIKMSTIQ